MLRIVLTLLTFKLISVGFAQTPQEKQLVLLTRVIQKNHYQPPPVNDSFSAQVFDRVLEELDEGNLYFTAAEIALLEPYRFKIDDEMMGKSSGFIPKLTELYKARLQKVNTVLTSLSSKPFTFDAKTSVNLSDIQAWPATEKIFEQRLGDYCKLKILNYIVDEAESDSVVLTKATLMQAESAARKKVIEKEKRQMIGSADTEKEMQKAIYEIYLHTIASNFDPHTSFFEPEEKQEFQELLSSESYKYGFAFDKTDEGKYKISSILPGSAAWKSGSIHRDDEIVSIQPDDGSNVRMDDANAEAVLATLSNASNKKITITIRSADGLTKTVSLHKEMQRNDENIVRGFVLDGTVKAGYISLPSFYTEWGNNGSSSCANDVAKEIVKLKRENIAGLILDLRYNGGGSLQEALELSGIFTDVGPGCLVRGSNGKTMILKDPNRGTIYDGPLIVMINGQSASASELVAGTLQDYGRALIVGSNSFGKATMQGVLPLDTLATNPEAESDFAKLYGYAKVTQGKLFRITGKTAQLNGVIPDVRIPDAFELSEYTERSYKNALPSDTVMKNVLFTKLPGYKVQTLQILSNNRLAKDAYFNNLAQVMKKLKIAKAATAVPLQWEEFVQWQQSQQYPKTLSSLRTHNSFTVQNSAFDNSVMKLDDYQAGINDYVKSELKQDKYIEEAYHIISDIIKNP
ncbi:MAG: carboxy terminal-processing peptidase [Agriterribacter sp.]